MIGSVATWGAWPVSDRGAEEQACGEGCATFTLFTKQNLSRESESILSHYLQQIVPVIVIKCANAGLYTPLCVQRVALLQVPWVNVTRVVAE